MSDIHRGEPGMPGRQGEAGVSGRQGEAGLLGPAGSTGLAGPPGGRGSPGIAGARGPAGRPMGRSQALAMFLFVVLAFVLLAYRSESQQRHLRETQRALAAQQAQIQTNVDTISREQRADCLFKFDIIGLPLVNVRAGVRVNPSLVELAEDARIAFLGKGCAGAINPRTGQPFGDPPEVRTK